MNVCMCVCVCARARVCVHAWMQPTMHTCIHKLQSIRTMHAHIAHETCNLISTQPM